MKTYAHHGFHEFVLCLGYRGNTIKDYFLNYEAMNNDFLSVLDKRSHIRYHNVHTEQGFGVTLADAGANTMTGGRIQKIRKYLDGETFLLTYGDGVSDVDIRGLVEFHKRHGRIATVTTVPPISRFGMMDLNRDDCVESFIEKPRTDGWMSGGFFALNRGVFDYLGGNDCIFERGPLERLAADGQLSRWLFLRHGHLSRIPATQRSVECRRCALEGLGVNVKPAFLAGFRREAVRRLGFHTRHEATGSARGGVLGPYVDQGDQAQRRRRRLARCGRKLVRNAG
jgi:glucose-1-phosphate cytidylyltransferase